MKDKLMRIISILVLLSVVLPLCVVPATATTTGTAVLVTDASALKAGDSIIIVAAAYDYALSTTQNNNNRGQSAVTKADSTVVFDETAQVIKLVDGAVSGTFGFSTDAGYLYAASSSNNYLRSMDTLNENGSWLITISDGEATVTAQGDNTRNRIFYNSSSKLFSAYVSDSTTQKAISIYLVESAQNGESDSEQSGEAGDSDTGTANVLITDSANLKVGDKIIIAALDYDYAISTTQNTNNRGQAAITKSDGSISFGSDAEIIELVEGTASDTFGLSVSTGYLYAVSSSSNHLRTKDTLSDSASWMITIDESTGAAAIVAQGDISRNIIRYNASGLFSCYAEGNTQKDVCIYVITDESGSDDGSTDTETDTSGTGFDSADDVIYNTVNGVITNWGARDELAQFLSVYASDYYVGSYAYDTMSRLSGGTSGSDAPDSELYAALQAMMVSEHTTFTKYSSSSSTDCKNYYPYTDCLKNDYSRISTIYLGYLVDSAWDSGVTYNQEHIWPKSKCIGTSSTDIGDIMHLRPANPTENSSRGNFAYGESSGYYTPNENVRGDCARTILYMYVRWGNTDYMWGSSGVMESMDILLKWMEEDPVDTWEMGRNDSVESITGVRNVFVDYPEYAWLLFGADIPSGMTTPSNSGQTATEHKWVDATCTAPRTCSLCGLTEGEALGHSYCAVVTAPTCTAMGYTTYTCSLCKDSYVGDYTDTVSHSYVAEVVASTCMAGGYTTYTCSGCQDSYVSDYTEIGDHSYVSRVVAPTCTASGYTVYTCPVCGDSYIDNTVTASGHSYSATVVAPTCTTAGYTLCTCFICGDSFTGNHTQALGHSYTATVTAPTCTSEGYTTYNCTVCADSCTGDITAVLEHTYEAGVCTGCGLVDSDAVVFPTLKIHHASVSFEDEIWYNLYFIASDLEDVVGMGLLVFDSFIENGTTAQANQIINDYAFDGTYYMAHTDGVPAKQMGDTLYFRLYAELYDGTYVYSDMVCYDMIIYANSILNKSTNSYMKALVVATLNYGAEAQQYFGYRTSTLMNSGLTSENQELAQAYGEDTMPDPGAVDSSKNGIFTNTGFGVSSITASFEAAFAMNYYVNPTYTPDGEVTLYYWTEEAYAAADALSAENASGSVVMTATGTGNQHFGAICGIAAKEMGDTVYAGAVYQSGGVTYSTVVMNYSMGKYCDTIAARESSTQRALSMAAAVYGASAKDYFDNL